MVLRCFHRNLAHLKWKKDHTAPSDQTGVWGERVGGKVVLLLDFKVSFKPHLSVPNTKSKPNGSQTHWSRLGKKKCHLLNAQ